MNKAAALNITWAKAFDEAYCHHASIFIPYISTSLFNPEIVYVGVTTRTKVIVNGRIKSASDKVVANYLPCNIVNGGLEVPLNASSIIESLALNSWTTLKNGSRGKLKEFPVNIFYQIEAQPLVTLSFNYDNNGTPYLLHEEKIEQLNNGDEIDLSIEFLQETTNLRNLKK